MRTAIPYIIFRGNLYTSSGTSRFILKIILNIPDSNLGLFTTTIFIYVIPPETDFNVRYVPKILRSIHSIQNSRFWFKLILTL